MVVRILKNKEKLVNCLLNYESFETVNNEIERSLDCLLNIRKEKKYLETVCVNSISVFLPINLPLYSLVLFAVIPSFQSLNIYLRPPLLARDILDDIIVILDFKTLFPKIEFSHSERKTFLKDYISSSDVVIFTGTYNNAMQVLEQCKPYSLFIYNGAGINPVVVTQNADLDLAVEKTIQSRIFNSGQDCAGPDVIFVHSSISKKFSDLLIAKLTILEVGQYTKHSVRVGKIIHKENILEISAMLIRNSDQIRYGGIIDFSKAIVYPTVIVSNLLKEKNYTEWFSPIFYISIFKTHDDLRKYFHTKEYKERAMYVSVFGKINYTIPNSIILENKNILDIERGNDAYGGHGHKANFSFCQTDGENKFHYRPILISHEIYEWTKRPNTR